MGFITLSDGHQAIVDEEDMEFLMQWRWCCTHTKRNRYALRTQRLPDGSRTTVYMHRVILDAGKGIEVDHDNGNGLDNRRSNIRLATSSQNSINVPKRAGCSSRFRGVSWMKSKKCWEAYINLNRRRSRIGYFHDEAEAARAYDQMATEMHGEFARLNFPMSELEGV